MMEGWGHPIPPARVLETAKAQSSFLGKIIHWVVCCCLPRGSSFGSMYLEFCKNAGDSLLLDLLGPPAINASRWVRSLMTHLSDDARHDAMPQPSKNLLDTLQYGRESNPY